MTKKNKTQDPESEDQQPVTQATVVIEDGEGNACFISGDLALVTKLAHALPHYHADLLSGPIAINEEALSQEAREAETAEAHEWLAHRSVPLPISQEEKSEPEESEE